MKVLQKEVEKHKDFMLMNVEEDYLKLPYKTLAFFKAAFELFEADFYVKADDDINLRPDRLATLLAKERTHPRTYLGYMKKVPVITDPKLKWYEKSGSLIGNEHFLHACGPIYALSAELVAALAIAKNDSLRMFSSKDVTVGSWMLAMNVNHGDNQAICDLVAHPHQLLSGIFHNVQTFDCSKCAIFGTKVTSLLDAPCPIYKWMGLCNPAQKLRELHKIDMCSKSPTPPPEDR